MKPEATIRRHRDNLRKAVLMPCACQSQGLTGHSAICLREECLMRDLIQGFSWALNELPEMDQQVERIEYEVNAL